MDWNKYYKKRSVNIPDVISKIKSGDRIVVGHAVGEPTILIDALIENKNNFRDVEIAHMVCLGKGDYCKPEMANHFRHNALFASVSTRNAVNNGQGDFTPCYFFQIPRLFSEGFMPVDVALVQVSCPDAHGFCSLGVSVDYTKAAVENAKLVIAQVNDKMPRTLGDSSVSIKEIDYFVEKSTPLIELKSGGITDVEKAIGQHCANLIEDRSTLQLGIGIIPDAVLSFLKNKKDLGIHSEMVSDGVIDLIEEGVITNKFKTVHKNKIVVTFIMGTRKLYDYVDDNPLFYFAPVNYTNDPFIIMQNYKMVSINSCVQVDLMGQVSSESVGLKQISGAGGQVDFIRGTNMAPGGKSIITMTSTTKNDECSKIVPFLEPGSAVTTSRNDVDYIVTEFGIAQLKGKTLRERGKQLIKISHPDFRSMLIEEWEKRFKEKY